MKIWFATVLPIPEDRLKRSMPSMDDLSFTKKSSGKNNPAGATAPVKIP
jgi:hypothetical protein